ncbi:1220_t:CDS:2 [Diversispora eburnea]|uniref:1220_t:CDS:1 n=1 Tax=Diversispora eburnea TaxID=1213867 RepID=A0A9N8VZM4_9GLOM|nr:1220_t:CDS:2 [Diversispora eburnea]
MIEFIKYDFELMIPHEYVIENIVTIIYFDGTDILNDFLDRITFIGFTNRYSEPDKLG